MLHARGNADAARAHFEKAAAEYQASGLTKQREATVKLF